MEYIRFFFFQFQISTSAGAHRKNNFARPTAGRKAVSPYRRSHGLYDDKEDGQRDNRDKYNKTQVHTHTNIAGPGTNTTWS